MTDEELQHIKRNGIMLKDAVYIVDKLIDDILQARTERSWLAWELHCRCNSCRQTQESPYCDIDDCIKEYWEVPTKEDWINESKKNIIQRCKENICQK